MTLNFSHRPIFPVHFPEENIIQVGSHEEDICDILPADPFGMDISSTVTALTGWLEDLAVSDYGGCQRGEVGVSKGQNPIFAGWNFWWDTAGFEPFLGETDDMLFRTKQINGDVANEALGYSGGGSSGRHDCWSMGDMISDCGDVRDLRDKFNLVAEKTDKTNLEDILGLPYGCGTMEGEVGAICVDDDATVNGDVDWQNYSGVATDVDDGSPHPALSFALAYLGVGDLLNVERVCKSLRFTVRNDPLLWNNIHIGHPLNERICDEDLIQLTNRAQGHLQCLSLVECKISDDCLRQILESNPGLIKLCLPGCSKLSIDGVISSLKSFQIGALKGLKYLRICGIGALWKETSEHLERFKALTSILGLHNHMQPNHYKPHFYCQGNSYLCSDDDRPLDVEICSKCQKLRLVYDCPAESCQVKDQGAQLCRACILCVSRCAKCGRCVSDVVYEETFFLELQCSDCSQDLQCQDGYDIGGSLSKDSALSELDG